MPYIVTIPSHIDVIAVASAIVESVNAVLDIHRDTIEFDQAAYDLLSSVEDGEARISDGELVVDDSSYAVGRL